MLRVFPGLIQFFGKIAVQACLPTVWMAFLRVQTILAPFPLSQHSLHIGSIPSCNGGPFLAF